MSVTITDKEYRADENKSLAYNGKSLVAVLYFNEDEFECFEDATEDELGIIYSELVQEKEDQLRYEKSMTTSYY